MTGSTRFTKMLSLTPSPALSLTRFTNTLSLTRSSVVSLVLAVTLMLSASLPAGAQTVAGAAGGRRATEAQLRAARRYIKQGWRTLARSNRQLAEAAVDPKFPPLAGNRRPVYVAPTENFAAVESRLRAELPADDFARIVLRRLPASGGETAEPGLLYLPHPYVVPGGRFNEMYGWDSYFTNVGLLRDGEVDLARDMVDNFIYQIEHYGKILNANRTYFLTRSQPPFLTRMILDVYRHKPDRAWLERTVPVIEKYYRYWADEPHTTGAAGLARYYDAGEGVAPEVVSAERDREGRTHYDLVRAYYRTHEVTDYDLTQYYDRARDELTPLFYKSDRSMRESGFDPSNRFGPFNADIIHYYPVCLNSLLYVMANDTAQILKTLGRPRDAAIWEYRAAAIKHYGVNRLMWDERDGLYYDYNFKTKAVRRYPFVTTFYPLWAGIATPQQAARVVANLHLFERAGGLQTSTNESGSQWDAPYGWAPMQLIAVEGLRRYGYEREANRISVNFLSLVLREFIEHNTIVEKYDVTTRRSQIGAGLKFGYKSNEIGFGWTNAAFVELYAALPATERAKVLNLDGAGVPDKK
ncbi:MAG: alpha,alpha-trehalase [Pyrinomonadaceae bacterium]|jgi:alpha,alpha-trehalase|nr:alpha,alpha-trehalase [Pyrinomonadaceae bacterium]